MNQDTQAHSLSEDHNPSSDHQTGDYPEAAPPSATQDWFEDGDASNDSANHASANHASANKSLSGKMGLLIGLGIGLVVGLVAAGSQFASSSPDAASEETTVVSTAPRQSVTVAPVESTQVSRTLQATGSVVASDLLPILPKTSGLQIQQVLVDDGDSVTAGQVMAVLDRAVLESQLAEAQAQLQSAQARVRQQEATVAQEQARRAEAESQFQRYNSLLQDGVISQEERDTRATSANTAAEEVRVAEANLNSARAEVQSQQARIQQLRTQIEQTLVRAPADGLVAERVARVGDVSSSSQKLFSMIRDRQLELQVTVPETQLAQVQIGAPVDVRSDADERIQLQGRVSEIAPLVNADTREATITVDLPSSPLLRPGMFLRADLVTAVAPGLTIPADAVVPQSDGRATVYRLVEGDRVEAVTVELGEVIGNRATDARIEVLQGLNPGDRVVVRGAGYLKEGDAVDVVEDRS